MIEDRSHHRQCQVQIGRRHCVIHARYQAIRVDIVAESAQGKSLMVVSYIYGSLESQNDGTTPECPLCVDAMREGLS